MQVYDSRVYTILTLAHRLAWLGFTYSHYTHYTCMMYVYRLLHALPTDRVPRAHDRALPRHGRVGGRHLRSVYYMVLYIVVLNRV